MIIYNVTTQVSHSINDSWVVWMKEKHIPEVMEKRCFYKHQFVKLLDVDETEGLTYAVQFYAETIALYEKYIEQYAPALREDVLNNWGDQAIAFRSLMCTVD